MNRRREEENTRTISDLFFSIFEYRYNLYVRPLISPCSRFVSLFFLLDELMHGTEWLRWEERTFRFSNP
jgi:hypothetical protein